jgi:hypothetical protein
MIPLLLRCVECADRGLDIIRGRFCNHKFQMQVPGLAGQLLDGFHAAYVIPASGPFKDKLYCHPATPFHVTSNWLGLEVDHGLNQEDVALAPIVHGGPATEMFMRLRAAVRALGQAFYILTPESRFLSLVFAIDGLCAPNEKWKGLPHRTYIAAVAADGERKLFATLLKDFDTAYTEVRNSIVHQGKSFVELGIDPIHSLKHLDRILGLCIETVMRHSFNTSAQLHKHALTTLGQADFQSEIMNYAAHVAALSGKHHKVTLPKW